MVHPWRLQQVLRSDLRNLTANSAPPYFQQTNDVNLTFNAPGFLAGGGLPGASVPLPTDPGRRTRGRRFRTPLAASGRMGSPGRWAFNTSSRRTTRLKRATSAREASTCGINRA